MPVDPTTVAVEAAGGFTAGYLIGLAIRKLSKWALMAVGFALLPLFALWYLGVITVNWAAVNTLVQQIVNWIEESTSSALAALANLGVTGFAIGAGAFLGLTSDHTCTRRRRSRRYIVRA